MTRNRLFKILEPPEEGDRISRYFDVFMISLIVLNILSLTLSTVQEIYFRYSAWFEGIEIVSVIIFTVEYLARLYSCIEDKRFSNPLKGRIQYAFQPLMIIDLIAILPFFLPFLGIDLRSFRVIRLFRIFRLFKLERYSFAITRIIEAFKKKFPDMIAAVSIIFVLIFIASTSIYFAEKDAQPEIFSSIPASMWWAVATLTTVGYGDAYPITVAGKIIGSIIAILGIAAIALPTAILSEGFSSIKNS